MNNFYPNNHYEHKQIFDDFKKFYPEIDINSIDEDLLLNILSNIFIEKEKNIVHQDTNTNIMGNDDVIANNILMSNELIPEMSIDTNLIYLNGKLNNYPIKILIDTGASACFSNKSIISKCGLEHLIDKESKVGVMGVHGTKSSLGLIWFVELDLDISNGNEQYVSIPICINVTDDTEIIEEQNKKDIEIKNEISKMKQCANTSFKLKAIELIEEKINESKNDQIELILGINFLKSYKANIDFGTRTLTLNESIKIKFK